MEIGSIWTAAAAAVPTIGLVATAIWKSYREWRAAHPKGESWGDREARSLERGREMLDRASEAYLDRLERDNARLEAECEELRFDRDRGWDLARWWDSKAHELRHDMLNHMMSSGFTQTIPKLPAFEDPYPKQTPLP